jgi:hypothetical protein
MLHVASTIRSRRNLLATPGVTNLSFDFLLPAGPRPFFKMAGEALETVEERFPKFSATATRHDCQSAFKFGSDAILVQLRLFRAD